MRKGVIVANSTGAVEWWKMTATGAGSALFTGAAFWLAGWSNYITRAEARQIAHEVAAPELAAITAALKTNAEALQALAEVQRETARNVQSLDVRVARLNGKFDRFSEDKANGE